VITDPAPIILPFSNFIGATKEEFEPIAKEIGKSIEKIMVHYKV